MPFHLICCSQLRRHSICWHLSLQCSTILIHHVHSVPFRISLWYQWSVVSSSIIDSLYVIFRHVLIRSWSDDPLCILQSFILVYLVDPLVLDMRTYFTFLSLSMGMPASDGVSFWSSFVAWQADFRWSTPQLLAGFLSNYLLNIFRPSCTPSDLIY